MMEVDNLPNLEDESSNEAYRKIASAITKCESNSAKQLWIYDIYSKLLKSGEQHNICGTYSDNQPEFWFYMTSTVCPGANHLLNLYVIHRRVGSFRIGVSEFNQTVEKKNQRSFLSCSLEYHNFKSTQPNVHYYIKTFCFKLAQVKEFQNILVIPINIEVNCQLLLHEAVVQKVKSEHSNGLQANNETADCLIENGNGKKVKIHKIVLALNSPQFRSILSSQSNSVFLDIDDESLEILVEYLYSGIVKDIHKKDCCKMLELAEKFQLENLFTLIEHAISIQVNVDNAVELALLAEKFKLVRMQEVVFKFISKNPKVILSDGWQKLEDNMTKKLLKWMFLNKT